MGVISALANELHRVRTEVLSRIDHHDAQFAVYYGRKAKNHIQADRDVMSMLIYRSGGLSGEFMGAAFMPDYGLPSSAIRIDVNGKPYTTLNVYDLKDKP